MRKLNDGPQETTRLLADTVRFARDTEALADATLEEFEAQGDKLHSSKRHLTSIESLASSTGDSVKLLKVRVFRQKLWLWTIISTLFVIILGLLYRLFANGGRLL